MKLTITDVSNIIDTGDTYAKNLNNKLKVIKAGA